VSRRWVGVALIVIAAGAGGLIWWTNRSAPIPSKPPAGAPKVGSCWQVDAATARTAMPWEARSTGCDAAHTAEVYHVGQVDHSLISKARAATGSDVKLGTNLMYAQARRACGVFASTYLGDDWHKAQVTVVANWIRPQEDGFFGCALVQTGDPAGQQFVSRSTSLRGAGGALEIECVSRSGGTLAYASCDAEHDGEFVGTYAVTPPDAPFDSKAVADTVTKGCDQVALSYLGLPADGKRADLHVGYVGPTTATTWLGSDQAFGCFVMADAKLRGTVRNLGARPLPH
jgi:hypothetical protein